MKPVNCPIDIHHVDRPKQSIASKNRTVLACSYEIERTFNSIIIFFFGLLMHQRKEAG